MTQTTTSSVASPSQLLTFLIADVREYSQFTLDHGDEAAARLAGRFGEEAAQAVSRRGGRVLEQSGDEILAVFESARQALRAAVDLQQAVLDHPLHPGSDPPSIGIGIDAGEAVPVDDGFRGAALNLAARLSALAGPGEVLASGTVTALARKVEGITYIERVPTHLKGFSEPVPVFQVASAEGGAVLEMAFDKTATKQILPVGGFLGSVPADELAGRGPELNHLCRLLEEVEVGSGRLVMLAGEPGAGKTRLAQELTAEAHTKGFLIGAGSCYENRESAAFFPFRDALGMLYAAAPSDARRQVAERWPYLARLVPGIPLLKPLDLTGQEDQERLFWSVSSFVELLAEVQPIAILLDDLHWADASSLDLLQHLARRTRALPVLILATYRDTEVDPQRPLEDAIREMHRQELVTRVPVRRLDRWGTRSMVAGILGGEEISEEFVTVVHEHTEGNPFFVRQVLGVLTQATELAGWRPGTKIQHLDVPESIRSVTAQRLRRLDQETQEVLRTASVLGQTFTFGDLLAIAMPDSNLPSQDLLDAMLKQASSVGLITSSDGEVYAFDHTLTRETLYRDISARRRRRLHLAVAETMERSVDPGGDHPPSDLARHLLEGDAPERALPYLLVAADQSMAVSARSEAEAGYRRAIEVAAEIGSQLKLAEAQEKLGEVLSQMGRYEEAIESLETAAHTYREIGDVRKALAVQVRLALALLSAQRPHASLEDLEAVLSGLARGEPSTILASAYAARARVHMALGQSSDQLVAAERAQTLAEQLGEQQILASALIDHATSLHDMGDPVGALPLIERAIVVAEESGDDLTLWRALNNAAVICWEQRGLGQAEVYFMRALEIAERSASPVHIAYSRATRGMCSWLRGEWTEASHWFEHAAVVARTLRASPAGWVLTAPAWVKSLKGREEEATRELEGCIARAEELGDRKLLMAARHALARQDVIQGRPAKALDMVQQMLSDTCLQTEERFQALLLAAEAALDLRRDGLAREYLEELRLLQFRREVWSAVPHAVLNGILASHEGRNDAARTIFGDALKQAREIPFRLGEAEVLRAWGLSEEAAGEPDRARGHLEEALNIYRDLGARPLADTVERELMARRPDSHARASKRHV